MRLFTVQTLEVVAKLKQYFIYFPDFNKCNFLIDPQDRLSFELPYHWLAEQYNIRKKHEFSSAPVWWYTSQQELLNNFKYIKTNECIIQAEVPDKHILLYDADLWEEGPFMQCPLGWRGHSLYLSNKWNEKEEALFDTLWNIYKKNSEATVETWKEIFNIQKSNKTERIHAITMFIDISWLEPNYKNNIENMEI